MVHHEVSHKLRIPIPPATDTRLLRLYNATCSRKSWIGMFYPLIIRQSKFFPQTDDIPRTFAQIRELDRVLS